jgi:hypothetical protein
MSKDPPSDTQAGADQCFLCRVGETEAQIGCNLPRATWSTSGRVRLKTRPLSAKAKHSRPLRGLSETPERPMAEGGGGNRARGKGQGEGLRSGVTQ